MPNRTIIIHHLHHLLRLLFHLYQRIVIHQSQRIVIHQSQLIVIHQLYLQSQRQILGVRKIEGYGIIRRIEFRRKITMTAQQIT
eukprot:UN13916